jgi:hypothetical protein
MFVLLLGYFKAKPVILSPRYHQVKIDLQYISQNIFPGSGFAPFTLNQKEKYNIYSRIFKLVCYQRWLGDVHCPALLEYLNSQAQAWMAPRYLFDAAIEYLSKQKIAIPAYSTLQKVISQKINQAKMRLNNIVNETISNKLRKAISDLFCDDVELNLS